jgi:polyferredoxin
MKRIEFGGPTLTARIRRISQIGFFLLFVWLLARTRINNSLAADTRSLHSINYFFKLDPLAALVNLLAGHTLYTALIWSLVILIPTFFLGRFFCGWICPWAA